MVTTSLAPSAPRVSAAPSARASLRGAPARKRRKVARPPQPRTPEDFFSAQAQHLLSDLLARRAACWKADSQPPLYFYGRHSEPVWGEVAQRRCSGTTLRFAGRRVLRLLTLPWTPEGTTADGHTSAEWRAALAGVCWRVGQHHREFARRLGESRACDLLRQIMDTLWQ